MRSHLDTELFISPMLDEYALKVGDSVFCFCCFEVSWFLLTLWGKKGAADGMDVLLWQKTSPYGLQLLA